jgi:hypothetical protein
MARQTGARAQAALAFESTYGLNPGAGFRRVPFATTSLGAERPLLDNEMLGFGRDPLAPQRDAITVDGDFVIPMDLENIGLWLKGAFGQPTTAGAVAATGTITLTANLNATDTVTVDGVVYTAVASGATGNQFNIGGTAALTATAMAAIINGSTNVAAAAVGAVVTLTAKVTGHGGNARTVATNAAARITLSGATLTGGANTHTFQSGNWTLPSMSIEVQMPDVPRFAMYTGVMVNQLQWSMQRSGLLTGTVGLIGQAESAAAATAAGSPTSLNYTRFGHFNGSILRNSVALASIVSADINYSNNLDPVAVIRADGNIDGLDPMIASLNGQFVARFADTTLFSQAIAGTPCQLDFGYTISASASLLFTAHAVYLPQPKAPVEGPGGVQATFDWQAALAVSPARMATVVLTNGVASY